MNIVLMYVVVVTPAEVPESKAPAEKPESKSPGPLWKWTGRLLKVIGLLMSACNLASQFPIA